MTIDIVAWYFSVMVVLADPQHSWLPHRYGPFESKAACEAERTKVHEQAAKLLDGRDLDGARFARLARLRGDQLAVAGVDGADQAVTAVAAGVGGY
jgi:hypothetical protein